MYKTFEKKKIAVKKIKELFKNGNLNIIIDNKNINAEKNIVLRETCKKFGATIILLKNSIAKIALKNILTKDTDLHNFTQGQNLLINIPEDRQKLIEILNNNIIFPIKNLKQAYWINKILTKEDIVKLSKLNSKQEELKVFIQILNFPIYNIFKKMQQPVEYFLKILKNLKNN